MFSAGPRPPDLVSADALLFHSFSLLASSMGHETESYGTYILLLLFYLSCFGIHHIAHCLDHDSGGLLVFCCHMQHRLPMTYGGLVETGSGGYLQCWDNPKGQVSAEKLVEVSGLPSQRAA